MRDLAVGFGEDRICVFSELPGVAAAQKASRPRRRPTTLRRRLARWLDSPGMLHQERSRRL
jgi:hypothetical protein